MRFFSSENKWFKWLPVFFFSQFGKFWNVEISLSKPRENFKPHSFTCMLQDYSPVTIYIHIVALFGFFSVITLKCHKFSCMGSANHRSPSDVHLEQHILVCHSDTSVPWFFRKIANFPVVFGIWITSTWILRCWETPGGNSKFFVALEMGSVMLREDGILS